MWEIYQKFYVDEYQNAKNWWCEADAKNILKNCLQISGSIVTTVKVKTTAKNTKILKEGQRKLFHLQKKIPKKSYAKV